MPDGRLLLPFWVGQMLASDEFSNLINAIYDAALGSSLWTRALEQAAAFIGGSGAEIVVRDMPGGSIAFRARWGMCPAEEQGGYGLVQRLAGLRVGMVTRSSLTTFAQEPRGRSCADGGHGGGPMEAMLTVLEKSPETEATFAVFRHELEGQTGDEARRHMQLVAPHLRRALTISRTVEQKNAEAASLAEALDSLSASMFLVDAEGRLTHANASGNRMLSAGDLLRRRGGRLVAGDAASDGAFRKILAVAASGDAAGKGVSIPLCTPCGEHYVAHVLPLPLCARRRACGRQGAVAAVFVHKAALEARSPSSVIAKIFKLTPSELRVLLAIVQVGGVPETAEALGVAETTVKTHLQRLFGKTGTARQAELVKVVASFANPLIA
jgi:DNA-binding CsgD family transcriptional regulator